MIDLEKTIDDLKLLNALCHGTVLDDAIALLNKQEIVRCKDCVYWQDNNEGYPHKDCKWREDETPDPDDYCSAGERK